jgi:hypothetical protein
MLGLGHSLVGGSVLTGYANTHSILFDGSNDHIDTGSTFQSTFQNSFAVSFWIKTPTASTLNNNAAFIATWGDSDQDVFQIYNKAGKLETIFISDGTQSRRRSSSAVFSGSNGTDGTNDAWMNITVAVTEASSGTTGFLVTMYKNGAVEASALVNDPVSITNQGNFTTSYNLFIGGRNLRGTVDSTAGGLIDDVAIFNTNFSSTASVQLAAAAAIYNDGTPIDLNNNLGDYTYSSNLVSYYKFNEGSGTTATDETGNSNGTLENGPTYSTDIP